MISNTISIQNSIFFHNQGTAIYLANQNVYLLEKVLFQNNSAKNGAGILISGHSTVIFGKDSNVAFIQNSVDYNGGVVYLRKHSNLIFDHNSIASFNDNNPKRGTILCEANSNVTFKATSQVTFRDGSAIYSSDNCHVKFAGNSKVIFINNQKQPTMSATFIYSKHYSHVSFEENSTALFSDNSAYFGGAIYSSYYSRITFKGKSSTVFNNNTVNNRGGAIYSVFSSSIVFEGNSTTVFSNNVGADYGGAINSQVSCSITFKESSTTEFTNNVATLGGAVSSYRTIIAFKGNSTTHLANNFAIDGGAMCCIRSSISFENSTTEFANNIATDGGAIYAKDTHISFKKNCNTKFFSNVAKNVGGAIYSLDRTISFKRNSCTKFIDNVAKSGGGIFSYNNFISFEESCTTKFHHNNANQGAAIFLDTNSYLSFVGLSSTVFSKNFAKEYGGAIAAGIESHIIFSDHSTIIFTHNNAPFGETVYCGSDSSITTKQNSTIKFNDVLAKWCTNTCLPYNGQGSMTIDSSGIVWCMVQKAFACLSEKCDCKNLEHSLRGLKNNAVVEIADKAILSSFIFMQHLTNVTVIGHNKLTVFCINNGRLIVRYCNNLMIEGIVWIGCGRYSEILDYPVSLIAIEGFSVTIKKCVFQHSMGPAIDSIHSDVVTISHCNFTGNNYYRGHGVAIIIHPRVTRHILAITNCLFSYHTGAKSVVYLWNRFTSYRIHVHIVFSNSSFYNIQGVPVYLSHYCSLHISGEIEFKNNRAENSAGIYVNDHSTVILGNNSNVKFINNSVDHSGSAVFISSQSRLIFEQNSIATFKDNKGVNGTIYSEGNSSIIFKATSQVIFDRNSATQCGAAIHSFNKSYVIFGGNSKVTFSNNVASTNQTSKNPIFGGIVLSSTYSYITFNGNSTTMFSNNWANTGAAVLSFYNSRITFKELSLVMFNNNVAFYCGTVTSVAFSNITFDDNTEVTFNHNTLSCTLTINYFESSAGAICTSQKTNVMFSGHSFVTFINNTAEQGGAIVFSESNVTIEGYSTVAFNSNIAMYSNGGAFLCFNSSIITIMGNSDVIFDSNKASQSGGAIHSYNMCKITFTDDSTSAFIANTARNNGGAILSGHPSKITFEGNSTIVFDGNTADNGGTFYFTNSAVTFKDTSMISFYNNKARQKGGVGYFGLNSKGIFEGTTTVKFDSNIAEQNAGVIYSKNSKILCKGNSVLTLIHNKATLSGGAFHFDYNSDVLFSQFTNITFNRNSALYGGAVSANDHSNVTVTGNSMLLFVNNEASQNGGAGYFSSYCNVILEEDAMITSDNNRALHGGAFCFNKKTTFLSKESSATFFYNNLATVSGGAANIVNNSTFILKDHITVSFINNSAQYGGTIFLDASAVMANNGNKSINFTSNNAKILGSSIYQDVVDLYNKSYLNDQVIGISSEFIATPPYELKFYDPAVCIDNDNDTQCSGYYIQNIMLGSDILIPACVLDYYNHFVDSTQFLVQSEFNPYYYISGPKQVLISCNTFQGINVMGSKVVSKSINLSINVTLNVVHNPEWRQRSVMLVVELSECHPGFWQYLKSEKCECYSANDIVYCSGSSSTIKRGYWFGSVTGKPTVTFCPINYCNFTCCETSNGYYHLSPVRENQCRSHRSGTACGSCIDGYTLSYDSTECLNIKSCTAGKTVLVILLTVTYWMVMVILVFIIMYYKVSIGYLYCITYYYSIVDILLSQSLQASSGLYLTVKVMSSFSKLTPQFLGQLCLTTGMSGIDQQFIHYVHPAAIILIIVIISLVARRSSRFTEIISRGIIHVICLLLLLSYTSIASTSLLLMTPLRFHEIDKVYTYLSPDIEYFRGHHLAYGIVALLCLISVVIGLPLLLTLQPFLNHNFNFIKIKPLLDQFQGCYKDNYQCFAGYYMICRLVVITIVIANSSNELIAQYFLIIACGIIALTHVTVKPYNNEMLNKFDGMVLQSIIFIAGLPLLDDFDSLLVTSIAFVLVTLPMLLFIALSMFLLKENLKKFITHCISKYEKPNRSTSIKATCNETSMKRFHLIVDDGVRQKTKVTICDM